MPSSPSCREAGFSLIEGLMAAALLLIVAVSVLPLFMRALESNTRGGRASQLSALTVGALEEVNQATVDREDFQLDATTVLPGGAIAGVRRTGTVYWDLGNLWEDDDPAKIGDERWVADKDSAAGPVLWSRSLDVYKYSFADVHRAITVGTASLSTLGDPRWFDSPLNSDDEGDLYDAHITEFRVHIVQDREGIPVGSGQRMSIGHFRTY